MSPINKLAGFPVEAGHKIYVNGQRFRVGNPGVKAIELAVELLDHRTRFQSLLRFRSAIRECETESCRAALSHLIEMTPSHDMRIIALWLRGRCGGYVGSQMIAKLAESEEERVRFLAAKAMQKMGVWATLADMAKNDPSERVRRIAAPRSTRKFRERLSSFSLNVESIPHTAKQRELFWSSEIDLRNPVRSKSLDFIRRVLLRIKNSVRSRTESVE